MANRILSRGKCWTVLAEVVMEAIRVDNLTDVTAEEAT